MVQSIFAGQGLARRRDDPLLCVVSISYQQSVDRNKNSLYEGRLHTQFGIKQAVQDTYLRPDHRLYYWQAVKIALEVKKYLIDNDQFDVSQVRK